MNNRMILFIYNISNTQSILSKCPKQTFKKVQNIQLRILVKYTTVHNPNKSLHISWQRLLHVLLLVKYLKVCWLYQSPGNIQCWRKKASVCGENRRGNGTDYTTPPLCRLVHREQNMDSFNPLHLLLHCQGQGSNPTLSGLIITSA